MQNLDIFIYTNANPLFVTTQCTDLLLGLLEKTVKVTPKKRRKMTPKS